MHKLPEFTLKPSDVLVHGTFTIDKDLWDYKLIFLCPNCNTVWISTDYSGLRPRPTDLFLHCHKLRGCGKAYKLLLDWDA